MRVQAGSNDGAKTQGPALTQDIDRHGTETDPQNKTLKQVIKLYRKVKVASLYASTFINT